MRAATRELTHLHTPDADRGKGLASLLMQKVCREADQYRMFLLLTAGEGLERFYLKFGFEVVQEHPITIMARAPLKPEAQVITLV